MGRVAFHEAAWGSIMSEVEKAVARDAIRVERRAKQLCPVDTGNLRSSITHEVAREGNTVVARVGTNVEYALYVELGTRRMSAQPYLRPALDLVR